MRTFDEAKEFAQQEHRDGGSHDWFRLCQVFARQCVGAPPFGASAREAFNGQPLASRHTSSPPPAGSIAYYGLPDRGAGHAVFTVHGGLVWSNDILRRGKIDRVQWDVFVSEWRLPYRGWIDACPDGELPVQRAKSGERYRQQKRVYAEKMRFGEDDSDSVWNLQIALMSKGFTFQNGPTGYYGAHTRTSCAAFQRRSGWSGRDADGIAGPRTVEQLGLIWVADE